MAQAQDFLLVLDVEGYDPTIKEPVVTNVSINFPPECKNACQHWMIQRVVDRTQLGMDVNFRPFAPRTDGSPTNLTRTGAMLKNVKAARGSDLRARGALAAVGISCYLRDKATYPWILHNGINQEKYKAKRLAVVDRMIKRKQDRLERKTKEITETSDATARWEYLMELTRGIEQDIADLQKRRAEIESAQVAAMPPREWWGLDDVDQNTVTSALKAWVTAIIEINIKYACNPSGPPKIEREREIDQKFLAIFGAEKQTRLSEEELIAKWRQDGTL